MVCDATERKRCLLSSPRRFVCGIADSRAVWPLFSLPKSKLSCFRYTEQILIVKNLFTINKRNFLCISVDGKQKSSGLLNLMRQNSVVCIFAVVTFERFLLL